MLSKRFVIITFLLALVAGSAVAASGQDPRIALQRGYRTGYSDGYMAGYRDSIDNESKNIARHPDYTEARRAFSTEYGKIEDYSDGYKQGFESGYATGYEKRSFESAIPADLAKRGDVSPPAELMETTVAAVTEPEPEPIQEPVIEETAVSPTVYESPETVETVETTETTSADLGTQYD